MRVVLIGHSMRGAGGLVVGINFVRCLSKVTPQHQFLLTAYPGIGFEGIKLPPGSEVFFFPGSGNLLRRVKFDLFELPKLVKDFAPDVVFGLGNSGLANPPCKQVIWIQDSHYVYPTKHFETERLRRRIIKGFHKFQLKRCLPKTDFFFCQTPVMRQRFAEHFDYPIERIKILPNAVSEFAKKDREQAKVPGVLRENGWFNLFLMGSFYPHKNQQVLIELFKNHREKLKNVRCIVTVDAKGHVSAPRFLEDIKKYGLDKHIINAGHLRQDELADYYYNTDALLFPTLLESFSTTYLEAMHFGLPILTSDLDFARYICGDAALYFDPWDLKDIVDKILMIKADSALRRKLVAKSRERVTSFFRPWREIVADAMKELELLVGNKKRKVNK